MQLRKAPIVRLLIAGLVMASTYGCAPTKKELQRDLDQVRAQLEGEQAAKKAADKSLHARIAELEQEIADREVRISQLSTTGQANAAELADLRDEQARRVAELATFKALFARLESLINAGTVHVSFRKGRMNVELSSAVLFDTGKTNLRAEGQAALDEIAAVFASVAHRDLMIGGHTDNVPISTRRYGSNWELSTQRAVVVVNHLIEQGLSPDHLSAAGFGEYDPIQTNDTDEGRQRNRRIEISLMPDLGQLAGIQEMVDKAERGANVPH